VSHTIYESLFRELFDNCGVDEIVWTIRILLQDLRLNITPQIVMGWYHPDAAESLHLSNGLRSILEDPELADPARRKMLSIALMVAFEPCSCKRYSMFAPAKEIVTCGDFIIERKIDGERMVIHAVRSAPGAGFKNFIVYSRKKITYKKYLAVMRAPLLECLAPDVLEVILDGEVVAWDHKRNIPMTFGTTRQVAEAQKNLGSDYFGGGGSGGGGGGGDEDSGGSEAEDDGDEDAAGESSGMEAASVNFIAFDCVWLRVAEGGDVAYKNLTLPVGNLTSCPLSQRKEALARALPVQKEGYITVLPYIRVRASGPKASDAIDRELLAAWGRCEEGIVVKAMDSPYACARSKYWLKVKPEYTTQNNSLDLVVVGGYSPEGRTWRNLAVQKYQLQYPNCLDFLLAMPRWASGEKERCQQTGGTAKEWVPLCKVGSGYKEKDVPVLNARLGPHWKKTPPKDSKDPRQPRWLLGALSADNMPEYFIEPKDSLVMQIKGSELFAASGGFCARVRARGSGSSYVNVTVRFPRIQKLRYDKGPNEAETEEQLEEIWNAGGSLSRQDPQQSLTGISRKRSAEGGAAPRAGSRSGASSKAPKILGVHAPPPRVDLVKSVLSGYFVVLPAPAAAYAAAVAHHRLDEAHFGTPAALKTTIASLGGHVVVADPRNGKPVTYVGLGGRAEGRPQVGVYGLLYAPVGADVKSPAWVAEAWALKEVPTALRVEHVAFAGATTAAALARVVDEYGEAHAGPPYTTATLAPLLVRVAVAASLAGAPPPRLTRDELLAFATPFTLFRDAALELEWKGSQAPALLGGKPGKAVGCLAFFPALASPETVAAAAAVAAAAREGGAGHGTPPSDPASLGASGDAAAAASAPWYAPHHERARQREDDARVAARAFRALGGQLAQQLSPEVDVVLVGGEGLEGAAEVAALRREAERRTSARERPLPPVGPLQWVAECMQRRELLPLKRLL
jgi:ATP-dependent DNA ligase